MKTKLISRIYRILQAKENCKKANNQNWIDNHEFTLFELERNFLPHGSGIDSGCIIDREFKENKVTLNVPYHNMDENGFYCGWSDFKIIVKPEFDSLDIKIIGKDKFYVKDYLYDLFYTCLNKEIEFNKIEV